MIYRKVAKIEERLSVVGFGCWSVAGYNWTDGSVPESQRAIHAAIDHGITFFDVAPIYGYGESEKALGQALKGHREKVFLASKCGLRWEKVDGPGINDLTPAQIRKEIEASLTRLQTDHLDLYQMHWMDHSTPIEETMETMRALVKEGKIRYIGASNFSLAEIARAETVAPIASHQVLYNMFDRNAGTYHGIALEYRSEDEILPDCEKNGRAFLPYSPLCQGLLSGRYYRGRDKDLSPSDMRNQNPKLRGAELDKRLDVVDQLQALADSAGMTLHAMTMGWLIHHPGVTSILCGARTVAQAISNAESGDTVLPEDVYGRIQEILEANPL